jgi:hypothetical protein
MSRGKPNSYDDDAPLTSDCFLATFGAAGLFPMTVLWSQSTVGPLMSSVGGGEMNVVEDVVGCW